MNAQRKLTEEKYIAFGNEIFDLIKFTSKDIKNLTKKYRIANSIITYLIKLGYIKKIGTGKYEAVSVIMTPQMVKMLRKEFAKLNAKYYNYKPIGELKKKMENDKHYDIVVKARHKSLNIEHLKNSNKLETVSVKLQGCEKYKLAQSAQLIGLTLSAYCANLLAAQNPVELNELNDKLYELNELNKKLSIENLNLKTLSKSAQQQQEMPKPSRPLSSAAEPKLKIFGSINFMTSIVLPLLIIAFGVTLGGIILKFLFF